MLTWKLVQIPEEQDDDDETEFSPWTDAELEALPKHEREFALTLKGSTSFRKLREKLFGSAPEPYLDISSINE